jgi:predicted TIM-barrel fold metal-dependent hydrolase
LEYVPIIRGPAAWLACAGNLTERIFMTNIAIADAHVHFWDLERNYYPWLTPARPSGPFGQTSAIRKTYLLADYLADSARQNIARMVHIEAGWDPADELGEMRWIQSIADRHGAPHAHIAHIDLSSEHARSLIEQHCAYPLFRGVRDRLQDGDFTHSDGSQTRIDSPQWREGLEVLDEHGLVFDLQAPPALAAKAAALARHCTGVRFVLTHAGYPSPPDDENAFDGWRDGLEALAESPNVAIKLSGLMLGEKVWHADHARQAADVLISTFGVERVMVASNFPVDRLFASLDVLFGTYRAWFSDRPEAEQRKMLHDNTCRLYKLQDGSVPGEGGFNGELRGRAKQTVA